MKLNKIFVMVTVFLMLTGCGTAQLRVIDDLDIVFGLGIEQGEKEGVIKVTTSGVTQEETAKEPVV